MATRDIWKPGYKFARTLKGRETMIPDGLSMEQEAAYLLEADEAYDNDPEKQALEKRNTRRSALYEREQEPARAWRKHFQATYLDSAVGLPDGWDHEAEREKFITNFKRERQDRERKAREAQAASAEEARRRAGIIPDDMSW